MNRLAIVAFVCFGIFLYGHAVFRRVHHKSNPVTVATTSDPDPIISVTQASPAPCVEQVPPAHYILGTVRIGDHIGYGPKDDLICFMVNGQFTKACLRLAKGESNGQH